MKSGASYFSTMLIFGTSLALVVALAGTNSTPFSDFLNERLNMQTFFQNFFSNPANAGTTALALGIGIATGNIVALSIPIILLALDFFLPIENLLAQILPTTGADAGLVTVSIFLMLIVKSMLALSAIIIYRGLFDL